jgi:CBS-domain-containing membrane protein
LAYDGENTEAFHRLGSHLVVAAALPLALGITLDMYVAVTRAFETSLPALLAALGTGAVLLFLWCVQPLLLRPRHQST